MQFLKRLALWVVVLALVPLALILAPITVVAAVVLPERVFYALCALGLLILLSPLILAVAFVVLVRDGRPIFYAAERMKTPERSFKLLKFRTMRAADDDSGVSGGDKAARVTPTGAFLREKRLDELPQLFNILRGDITFVGPRPPLKRYVELYPALYADVLKAQPGITGLATIVFHRTEERLLAGCRTAEETEAVYCRRCVPRKARIDRLYAARRTICSDFRMMFATIFRRLGVH